MRVAGFIVAAVLVPGLHAPASRALDLAQDAASDAAYANGWQDGDDGGIGWNGGWEFYWLGSLGDVGYAVESSTLNGAGDPNGDGDIDTNGLAWKLSARNGVEVGAERRLETPMKIGDTFSIDLDVADLPLDVFAIVDFESDASSIPRMSFGLRDGASTYHYYDGEGDTDSGVVVNEGGLHVDFTVTGSNTYVIDLAPRVGAPASHAGILHGNGPIATVGVHLTADVSPTMRHAFFNSALLVPEPGSGGTSAASALAALACIRRARRMR
jgi:hypothetical protein